MRHALAAKTIGLSAMTRRAAPDIWHPYATFAYPRAEHAEILQVNRGHAIPSVPMHKVIACNTHHKTLRFPEVTATR
jgi:hypothetical protein